MGIIPQKPIVRLWNSGGVGLIIQCKSGVRYSNQTGGHACLHPEIEGVYVPLVNEVIDQQAKLEAYFTGPKWQGWCNDGIDSESAEFINSVLDESPYTKGINVDSNRLGDSHEAWVFVILSSVENNNKFSELFGFTGKSAVLTWRNSD